MQDNIFMPSDSYIPELYNLELGHCVAKALHALILQNKLVGFHNIILVWLLKIREAQSSFDLKLTF